MAKTFPILVISLARIGPLVNGGRASLSDLDAKFNNALLAFEVHHESGEWNGRSTHRNQHLILSLVKDN